MSWDVDVWPITVLVVHVPQFSAVFGMTGTTHSRLCSTVKKESFFHPFFFFFLMESNNALRGLTQPKQVLDPGEVSSSFHPAGWHHRALTGHQPAQGRRVLANQEALQSRGKPSIQPTKMPSANKGKTSWRPEKQ